MSTPENLIGKSYGSLIVKREVKPDLFFCLCKPASLIYLASPYSHPDVTVRQWRWTQVCMAAAMMMERGLFVFSPIAHTHPIITAGSVTQLAQFGWEFWAAYNELLISRCDELHVLMLDGWRESVGVTAEIAIAERLNKPVKYI